MTQSRAQARIQMGGLSQEVKQVPKQIHGTINAVVTTNCSR